MILKGASVGIPLTLLQSVSTNLHYGQIPHPHFTPLQIASNFVIGSAVYNSDRIDENTSTFEKFMIDASVVASLAYLSSDSWTIPLVPCLYFLQKNYSSTKTAIGPIKPFFVAFFWTLATYYLPLLRLHDLDGLKDAITPISIFLSMSAFSHAADIQDIQEDMQENIITPAVRMGEVESCNYAIACILASIIVHHLHLNYGRVDAFYDVSCLYVTIFILSVSTLSESEAQKDVEIYRNLCLLLLGGGVGLEILKNRETIPIEIATQMLHSSEGVHKETINLITWIVEKIENYPDGVKQFIITILTKCIESGDKIGSLLLKIYIQIISKFS